MRLARCLALLALPVLPAHAFDCARARLPLEKSICAAPAAKASDGAMEAAFESVRARLDGAERKAALDDQRAWLKGRNDSCPQNPKPAACAESMNTARVAVLTGKAESGPGPERAPLPYFVRQAPDRARIAVALQLYRFPDPATPGERRLNALADETVAKTEFRKDEPDERSWAREETWSITYAAPTFLSIWANLYSDSGGAHPSTDGRGLHIDMASGQRLAFADLFEPRAGAEIARRCLVEIRKEKAERGAEIDDPAKLARDVEAVVKDLGNWSFKASEAAIFFDAYAVGAYAEGPYGCDLPFADLGPLAKRPLPPR